MSQRNVTTLSCYNFEAHEPILIFSRNVTEKVGNQNRRIIFLPYLTCASALPGETGKPEIASIHFNCCCMRFCLQTHKARKKYHLSQLNHPSLSKRLTVCTRQDVWRQQSILRCYHHALPLPSLPGSVPAWKREFTFFIMNFIKSGMKVNRQYYWDSLRLSYYLNKC